MGGDVLRLIAVALALLLIAPPSAALGRSRPGAHSVCGGRLGVPKVSEVLDPSVSAPGAVRAQVECLDGSTTAVTRAPTRAASTTIHRFMASTTTYSDLATFSWDAAGRIRTAHVGGGPELQFGDSLNGVETMTLSVPVASGRLPCERTLQRRANGALQALEYAGEQDSQVLTYGHRTFAVLEDVTASEGDTLFDVVDHAMAGVPASVQFRPTGQVWLTDEYDARRRLVSRKYSVGEETSTELRSAYDAADREVAHQRPNGRTVFFTYAPDSRLAHTEFGARPSLYAAASTAQPWTVTPAQGSALGHRLVFQDHLYDYDAGLYRARARVLDPSTGVFLQRDPAGYTDSVNLYAGFKNDPVNKRDPTGMLDPNTAPAVVTATGLVLEYGPLLLSLGGGVPAMSVSTVGAPLLLALGSIAGPGALMPRSSGVMRFTVSYDRSPQSRPGLTEPKFAYDPVSYERMRQMYPDAPVYYAGDDEGAGGRQILLSASEQTNWVETRDDEGPRNLGDKSLEGPIFPPAPLRFGSTHGNSHATPKPAQGYTLRDRTTGDILKYGETTMGSARYSKDYLRKENAELVFETEGTKAEMHRWQHEKILEHKKTHNGNRPRLNRSDY